MTITEMKQTAFENGRNPKRVTQRNYLFHKGFLESEGCEFHNLRRAKIDAYILEHYIIELNPYDLLVGRLNNDYELSEKEKAEIEEAKRLINATGWFISGAQTALTGHRVIDFELILHKGIKGVLAQIEEKLAALDMRKPDSCEAEITYQSMKISLNGVLHLAERTRETLEGLAAAQSNAKRKAELTQMAEMFTRIPYEPAESFWEALQSMWFMQFCLYLVDDVTLTGNLDDYMYPFYKKDIENGKITKEEAFHLIEQLYFKHNEIYDSWPASIMIGGVDRKGNPVWNELTYMCVEAIRTTGLINPSVSIAYTEDMPEDLLKLAVEILGEGYTRPAIFNDAVIQKGLRDAGVSKEDARRYNHSTCVEITPNGAANILVATPYVNLCKAFEYILYEKEKPYTIGVLKRVGPGWGGAEKTPFLAHDVDFSLDEIHTYDEFLVLFKKVLAEIIESHVTGALRVTEIRRRYTSSPLASAFLNDCIELGKDSSVGGARYNFCYPNFPGVINLIDSLAAIKKMVFEEKRLTLREMAQLCKTNFEGAENTRQYILKRCPKFGNNDEYVDTIGEDIYRFIDEEVRSYKSCIGGTVHPSYFAYVYHGLLGELTDATPDGRLAGKALSEHLGAFTGMDKNGPTAVMHSIARLDQSRGIGGIATNYRFAKNFINNENGNQVACNFIRTFMRSNCFEIQFNVIDKEVLLAAKENPEEYSTLLVRVAGYSDYFVNLAENVQDEIILRTENGEC